VKNPFLDEKTLAIATTKLDQFQALINDFMNNCPVEGLVIQSALLKAIADDYRELTELNETCLQVVSLAALVQITQMAIKNVQEAEATETQDEV
jgi:hypothetical protein